MSNQHFTMTEEQTQLRLSEWAQIQHYDSNRQPCYCGRYTLYCFCGHSIEITIPCGHTRANGKFGVSYQPINVLKAANVTLIGYCHICRRQVGSMCCIHPFVVLGLIN
jgi:hypothetical protein